LQRSLLPERLPDVPGIESAARYLPGAVGVAVGGDWYDVFALEDGSAGIVVGDVVGHGVRAAATMGRLRHVLRAYLNDGLSPAESLRRLNRLSCQEGDDVFATVACFVVAPSRTRVRLASAGHPPPLVRSAEGVVETLEGGRSLPVGAAAEAEYKEVEIALEPGSTLLVYTDGLIERRSESIDAGIQRLMAAFREAPSAVEQLVDRLLDRAILGDTGDDAALVAVHLQPVASRRLALELQPEPQALAPMRAELRSWLQGAGASDEEVFDILVAVNEACSNAVEHPLGVEKASVTLEAEMTNGEVSILIRDKGSWRPPGPPGERGRGFEFMQALMENVDVTRSDTGTVVRLQRRLHRGAKT